MIGEDSRADLDGIEIITGLSVYKFDFAHPGDANKRRTLTVGARSPVEFDGTAATSGAYWIRAAGHAWERVAFEADEVTLPLAAEIDVELGNYHPKKRDVELGNYHPKSGVYVRLYAPGAGDSAAPLTEFTPSDEGPTRLDSLAPGRYEVRVEVGSWREAHMTIGSTVVDAIAGERSKVHIDLVDLPPVLPPVPLEGTLALQADWPVKGVDLVVRSLIPRACDMDDDRYASIGGGRFHGHDLTRWSQSVGVMFIDWSAMEAVSGDAQTQHWKAGLVQPGKYQLTVRPFEFVRTVEVGPEGLTNCELVVPPPKGK